MGLCMECKAVLQAFVSCLKLYEKASGTDDDLMKCTHFMHGWWNGHEM